MSRIASNMHEYKLAHSTKGNRTINSKREIANDCNCPAGKLGAWNESKLN